MDTATKLIISILLATFYAPAATAYEFHDPFPNVKIVDGDLHISRPGGGTSLAYPNAGISKDIPVNTSKGQFLVPVQKTLPVEPTKLAKAATKFARALPVVGTGLAIYDLLCDHTDICGDDGQWSKTLTGDEALEAQLALLPGETAPLGRWCMSSVNSGECYPGMTLEQAKTARCSICEYKLDYVDVYGQFVDVYYKARRKDRPEDPFDSLYIFARGGMTGVTLPPVPSAPPTEQDWTEAEAALDAKRPETAQALYESDAPVPVSASTQASPVIQTIVTSSTQVKDDQGNITGTQTHTTTVTVTDTSTTNNISYNITETTITENYDSSNQLTGTTETTSSNEPPKPPPTETPTIEFDNVSSSELEQEQPEFNLPTPVSWGEGTCPPDVDLGIYDLTISYAPACDAADMLRPIFLLLASVTAMFIVAGVSRKD